MPFKTICAGISGHGDEQHTVVQALELAAELSAKLNFIHVNDTHAGEASLAFVDHGARLDEATLRKYVLAESNDDDRCKAANYDIHKGDWLQVLVGLTVDADLLILGHHHVGSLRELFTLSKDEQIINRTHCPIMVVPTADS
ncbi:MAG: universal stress protein [Planctomycetota bacterium]|jgi:nucleotide-binding universal stress UspA family protein|nr:universal stress protein [Planctomycetota bacterium]